MYILLVYRELEGRREEEREKRDIEGYIYVKCEEEGDIESDKQCIRKMKTIRERKKKIG